MNNVPMNQEMLDGYIAKTNAIIADQTSKLVIAEVQVEQAIKQNAALQQKVQELTAELEKIKAQPTEPEERCTEDTKAES